MLNGIASTLAVSFKYLFMRETGMNGTSVTDGHLPIQEQIALANGHSQKVRPS